MAADINVRSVARDAVGDVDGMGRSAAMTAWMAAALTLCGTAVLMTLIFAEVDCFSLTNICLFLWFDINAPRPIMFRVNLKNRLASRL